MTGVEIATGCDDYIATHVRVRSIAKARTLVFAGLTFLASFASPMASAASVEIQSIRIGFQDQWKVGHWTPFEIGLRSDGPANARVVITVPDGDGIPVRTVSPALDITAGETTLLVYAKPGRRETPVEVLLEDEGTEIAQRRFPADELPTGLLSTQELVLVVGASESFALTTQNRQDSARTVMVKADDLAEFPTHWYGYDTLDAVVLLTSQLEPFSGLSPDDQRLHALQQWIGMGGRLVLSAGENAEQHLAKGLPLASFAPGEFQGMATFRRSGVLETYAETTDPLSSAGSVQVPRLANVSGKVEAYEGNSPSELPIVVRSPVGFGQIAFIGVNIDGPLIADWAAKGRLYNRLLGKPAEPRISEADTKLGEVTHMGYSDLAGQLRSSLDQFPGVSTVPFWWIGAIALVYILLIGPGDYFLLKRLKRMELTWVTFPLLVVLFSAAAIAWAWSGKGSQVLLNQVDVIDVDLSEPGGSPALSRGTSWMTIFSPATEQYDLRLEPQSAANPPLLSWLGLPGSAVGGMDATVGQPLFRQAYTSYPASGDLLGAPVAAWATKGFTARWRSEVEPGITAKLSVSDIHADVIQGTILNNLDSPLEDCYLLYDLWAYPIGTIKPGDQATLDTNSAARTIETFLTGRRIGSAGEGARGYDVRNVDRNRVMQMIMFHDAAGGQRYTQLMNRYEDTMDLSGHLSAGRAILLAKGPAGPQLELKDQSLSAENRHHTTYYRFLIAIDNTRR